MGCGCWCGEKLVAGKLFVSNGAVIGGGAAICCCGMAEESVMAAIGAPRSTELRGTGAPFP